MQLMLDTSAVNLLLDGSVDVEALRGHGVFITPVQMAELQDTRRTERRDALLATVQRVNPAPVQATAVWGDTKWGQGLWASEDNLVPAIQKRIQELDAAAGKKPKNPYNQSRDARIIEAAIREKLVLVSNDGTMRQAAEEFGCVVLTPLELTNSTH